jgi:type II secretory pathway component PulF
MSTYQYTCLNQNQQRDVGTLEASSQGVAANILRERGLRVLELIEVGSGSALNSSDVSVILSQVLPISTGQKVFFFRQLALMLRSGLSINESLEIEQKLFGGRLSKVISDINHQVRSGNSLSNSFVDHKKLFPTMAEHLIRSAEATGELDVVMERIATHIEKKQDLSRQTMTTMLYPGITMLIAIAMFYMLVTKVIPKFAEFFEKAGKTMPPETQSMVNLAKFFNDWGSVIVVTIIIIFIGLSYFHTKPKGRLVLDNIALKLPIVGSVILYGAMSQISWTLSMLLKSGLTLLESLGIIRSLVSNQVISDDIEKARLGILSGKNFGASLAGSSLTPLVQNLIAVGEKSGSLVQVLEESGHHYEEALKHKNKVLSGLMEPVSILLIGGMVAYVYIAFFKAIFALSG